MKNKIIVIAVLSVSALAIWSGFSLYSGLANSAELQIIIAPQAVKMSYNNKNQIINSEEKIKLKPGKYQLVFSKENFNDTKKEIDIKKDSSTILTVVLEPKNANGIKEFTSKVNQTALQGIGDIEHAESEKFYENNPITSKLQYKNLIYSIDYTVNPDTPGGSITIIVKAPNGYRQSAIDKIKSWGYNPEEFNIKFKDYTNPFAL